MLANVAMVFYTCRIMDRYVIGLLVYSCDL